MKPPHSRRSPAPQVLAALLTLAAPSAASAEISTQIPWLDPSKALSLPDPSPFEALAVDQAIQVTGAPANPTIRPRMATQIPQCHLDDLLAANDLGCFFLMGERKLCIFQNSPTAPPGPHKKGVAPATGLNGIHEQQWKTASAAEAAELAAALAECVRGREISATASGALLTLKGPRAFHKYVAEGPVRDLGLCLEPHVPPAQPAPKETMVFALAHSRAGNQKGALRPNGLGGEGDVNESAGIAAMLEQMVNATADNNDEPLIREDPLTNSIVVVDHEARREFYRQLIAQLDQERRMVEITASIIDLEITDSLDWQSALLVRGSQKIESREVPFRSGFGADASLPGALDGAVPALPDLAAGTAGGLNHQTLIVGSSFALLSQIQTLQTAGKAQVLSRPSVVSLDNHPARLTDKTKAYIPVAGERDSKLYTAEAGLDLVVLPRVSADGSGIYLAIDVGEGKFPESVTTEEGIVDQTKTNRIVTQAVVADGQSLVIGGRYRNEQISNESHVPLLGKIPLLGLPFKNKSVVNGRFQRLYIITPRLLAPSPDLTAELAGMDVGTEGGLPSPDLFSAPSDPAAAPAGKAAEPSTWKADPPPTAKPGLFQRIGGLFRRDSKAKSPEQKPKPARNR